MSEAADLLPVRTANPSRLPVPIETTAVEDESAKEPDAGLHKFLLLTIETGASDLHLTVGRPPSARRDGVLVPYEGEEPLDSATVERMVMSILDASKQHELAADRQVD